MAAEDDDADGIQSDDHTIKVCSMHLCVCLQGVLSGRQGYTDDVDSVASVIVQRDFVGSCSKEWMRRQNVMMGTAFSLMRSHHQGSNPCVCMSSVGDTMQHLDDAWNGAQRGVIWPLHCEFHFTSIYGIGAVAFLEEDEAVDGKWPEDDTAVESSRYFGALHPAAVLLICTSDREAHGSTVQ